jgi:multiple sugar transport system ATP-binding protein
VALARAIVREPTVFLLDEPLSNLDAKLRASAREELEHFHKRIGTTTIYVTHDQVEAMGMGDRIVVLHQGFVRQMGTPSEVYEDPADTFVATFLGSPPMNLLETEALVVGFRPEQFLPANLVHDSAAIPLKFRVTIVEYLGAERILYGKLENGRFAGKELISRIPSNTPAKYEVDSVNDFALARRDVRYFDKQTEKRTGPKEFVWS